MAIRFGSSTTTPEPSEPHVTFYEHRDYGGSYRRFVAGKYNIDSLEGIYAIKNDQLSSLRIPSGLRVTLYEHRDWTGASKVFTSDTPYVGDDFNDRTSSFKIEHV